MLVPVRWLKDYVNIDIDTKEFADKMTMSGSKVETIEKMGEGIEGVVVGRIESINPHPNADKLVICKINIGQQLLQVVTGATNIKEGDYIPVAVDGAKLAGGLKIKKGKLRGEASEGMLCSQEEMGISKNLIPEALKDGIWILDKEYPLGVNIMEAIPFEDEIIEFEITSNRPDCLSMLGMAREAAATLGTKLKYPEIQLKEGKEKAAEKIKVKIEDVEGCQRYVAKVIKNVKIQQSPQWMQQRLMKAGVRPINNVVDVTNYVMLEYGQPLHAFDLEKIAGDTIIIRKAKDQEEFKTLDGVNRILNADMTMITDSERSLAIGGVMGGEDSEITETTQWILLESANFNNDLIRSTSKRLNLRTEASSRFEKGVDPNLADIAADRVCQLITDLEIGEVLEGMVEVYPTKKEIIQTSIRPNRINQLLGTDLSIKAMVEILKALEIEAVEEGEEIKVNIPTFRNDLQMEADFVEEIGRIYGFDKIVPTMARGNIVVGGKTNGQLMEELAKSQLNSMGFNEVLSYSFVSPKSVEKILLPADSIKRNFVRLINPLGDETSVMRTSLLPNMLDILSRNFNRKNEEVRAFELGRIFIPKSEESKELPYEIPNLVLGVYGEGEDFYTLKGVIETLLDGMGIKDYSYEVEKHHPTYHPGRCANLMIHDRVAGVLGELHPSVLENYDIHKKCYCAELDFSILMALTRLDKLYQPLPKYPAITRDFAIVVKEDLYVREIEKIISDKGGKILESFKLFDVYRGNQVPAGCKSVAYTLTYRHKERTLTDEDVNKVHETIVDTITQQLGGTLRD
ncbi:phenylalanine--tRNA ligase subunit beta [Alkaliphilus serpentinus]|uniref:Phenylalanine--tRNA ligase beta subunit n=1 Tax=Alkaliphilus serpentinus TaxID=1482731 RepID=A0A833HNL2_9FIRM|nr:phenylalanine--tRNA ligase subunit beta [Alkaliphilus serpentinus]KAB3529809.1 phenylalanine--tRNA ligase subunit beta [Alkaliphilus serpentinus]